MLAFSVSETTPGSGTVSSVLVLKQVQNAAKLYKCSTGSLSSADLGKKDAG
jgi:hypothetical protein